MQALSFQVKIFHPLATITITCSSIPDVIVEYCTSNVHSSQSSHSDRKTTRSVRVVYSLSRRLMKINTHNQDPSTPNTTFRTRRTVSLGDVRHINDDAIMEGLVKEESMRSACRVLGLPTVRDWLVWELEAIKRLWAVRTEWGHYIHLTKWT